MSGPPHLPPPPPPLNYASSRMPGRSGPVLSWPMVCVGLLAGTGVSFALWTAGWDWFNRHGDSMVGAIIAIVSVKFVVGVVLLFLGVKPRGLGLGLILSLVLGFLVFFGNCTLHLNN